MKKLKLTSFVTDKGIYTFHNVIDIIVKDESGQILYSTMKQKDLEQKPLKRR